VTFRALGGALPAAMLWLLLVATAAFAADATPAPTPGGAGDPRSPGQGPGLVGDPAFAIAVLVFVAIASAVATLVYVRLTAPDEDRLSRRGPGPS
jgi:hypothetical protein